MKIIEKIKEFFRNLKKKNTLVIEEGSSNNVISKDKFINTIDLKSKQEIMDLQIKVENNQIPINDLSIFEVMDLIDLYNEQLNVM